jgi:hypothetical protein
MAMHLTDGDLERYVTGMVHHGPEIKWIEDHLYACPACTERMICIQDSIDDPEAGSIETDTPDLYRSEGPLQ